MVNDIMRKALLLAKYDSAKDEVLYRIAELNAAEHKRDRLRRQLIELIGEAELMEITEEEPTEF